MKPKVAVLVLAYNNYEDTSECLRSLLNVDYPNLSFWLVDNGSHEEMAQRIAVTFPSVRVVRTGRNLGVAGGFNAGIIPALREGADYVFILNNDTVVERDVISNLVTQGKEDPRIGVLMPKILYYSDRQFIWSAGARYRRFPPAIVMIGLNQRDGPAYDVPRDLEYAPTCGLLISRKVFEEVGLFDDGYLFFYDDWDYSIRVRKAGYIIRYVPQARLYHKVSRTIRSYQRSALFWRIWGQSGGRFYRRHGSPPWLSALIHLGYIALREGLRNGPIAMAQFIWGAVEGYSRPLSPYPNLSGSGDGSPSGI